MKKQLSLCPISITFLVTRVNKDTNSWSVGNRTNPGVYNVEKRYQQAENAGEAERDTCGLWTSQMRRILKVGYLSFHSPGVSWHSPQMFSEAFMNLHGERYLRDRWNFWSQIFAFPKSHTISITLSWVQCISPALDFGLGYVTLLWLMAPGQKWQCINSQPRPQRALYIFICFHVPIPSPQEHDLNSSLNGPRRKKDI